MKRSGAQVDMRMENEVGTIHILWGWGGYKHKLLSLSSPDKVIDEK